MKTLDINKHSDIEAEQYLLGTLISFENSVIKCYDKLEPGDFYDQFHQKLYECLIQMFAKNIKIELLGVQREFNKMFSNLKKDFDILKLIDKSPSDANIDYYIRLIKDKSLTRQFLISQYSSLKIDETKAIQDTITESQEKLVRLTNIQSNSYINFYHAITEQRELLDKRLKGEKSIVGWKWSSDKLTAMSGGIEPGYVYVFGGLKKTGKSKFIIDQIHSLYEQKVPSLFLSLEMGRSIVIRWIWSRFAKIDSMKIRMPVDQSGINNLSEEEIYHLNDAQKKIESLDDLLAVNTKSFLNFSQIKASIYKAITQLDIKVVFLDHLQRCNIENRRGQNEAKAIEEFVYHLADMAKEYNIALVILSQLSNVAEGKEAEIRDLKHSGGIGEGVDFVGIMNRLSRIKKKEKNSNEMHIDCWQRDGQSGRITIKFDLSIGVFQDEIYVNPFETQQKAIPF